MQPEQRFVDWFYAPIAPFVERPLLIASVAVLFFVAAAGLSLSRKKVAWAPLVTAIGWTIYAAWEQHCLAVRYAIRIDLILLAPFLYALTLFGVAGLFYSNPRQYTLRQQFSLREMLILMTFVAVAMGTAVWIAR